MRRLYKQTLLYLTILISLSGANIFTVVAAVDQNPLLFPIVRVGDTNIGGLSIEAARDVLRSVNAVKMQSASIVVIFSDKQYHLHASDIDLKLDDMRTVQTAFAEPRQGNMLMRFIAYHTAHDMRPIVLLDTEKLSTWVQAIAADINRPAVPASIHDENSVLSIIPSVQGRELDLVNSVHAITNAILTDQTFVNLFVRSIPPHIVDNDLKHITGIVASYQTTFNPSHTARTQNIELATKALNSTLLRPGEILSFNSIVGPRTQQRGYQKAPVFINEDLIDDWGGGICQVSSTLYNAALLADMTIIERSAHYQPVSYVPIGLDATVDFDSMLDLKIQNSLHNSLFIMAEIKGNEIVVRIYGRAEIPKPLIELATTSLTTIEPKNSNYTRCEHKPRGTACGSGRSKRI